MSDLAWSKTSLYVATMPGYSFRIHDSGQRTFQVVITRVTDQYGNGTIVDYPPKFGSLPAAKNYVGSWIIMHRHELPEEVSNVSEG